MGALGRILASSPSAIDDYWYQDRGAPSAAGVRVTADSAMTVSAVYACVTFIAESIASVPLPIYQWVEVLGQRGKQTAPNHPLWDVLNYSPNEYQTAIAFREMMTAFALLRPRGIAEILPGPRGPVDQLIPLHPDLVRRETLADGTLRYKYRDPLKNGQERVLMPDQVFVVEGRYGRSVLEFAAETVGLDLAMQKYQGQLFSRGARPIGALKTDKILNETQKTNLRESLDEYTISGQYSGRPLLLQDGMDWKEIGLNSQQAEIVASRALSIADAARFFRVPLHKIQELNRATNNNIEEQGRDATEGLIPWAERWEQAIRRDLIIAKQIFFAEHNLDGLQRGNTIDRFNAYAIAIMWGVFNPNEVRALENKNPYPGGEQYIRPLNEGPVNASGLPPSPTGPAATDLLPAPVEKADPGVLAQLRGFARQAAARAVRKEQATLEKLADRTGGTGQGWIGGIHSFYAEHAEFVAQVMRLTEADSRAYVMARAERLIAGGRAALLEDELDRVDALEALSLERSPDFTGQRALPATSALLALPDGVTAELRQAAQPDVHVTVQPTKPPDVHVNVEKSDVHVTAPAPDMAPIAEALGRLEALLTQPRAVIRDKNGRITGWEALSNG